jgi:uncharacterized protein
VEFGVNYSLAAEDLICRGQIRADRFKCPAWPDLIAQARTSLPVYVHFPLRAGSGIGDAVDDEAHASAAWNQVERLLAQTGTPFVNVHLAPTVQDFPQIAADTADPQQIELLTEHLLRDLNAVVARFGAERVIAENIPPGWGFLRPAVLPGVITRVVEETGCGLLLDLSHARIAAYSLGLSPYEYIRALPLAAVREVHVTGVQRINAEWIACAQRAGIDSEILQKHAGQWYDHLPMTPEDWEILGWAMEQIHNGAWGKPWIITLEYGGIRGWLEAITQKEVLLEQAPRLYQLVK